MTFSARRAAWQARPRWIESIAAVVLLLVAWHLLARTVFASTHVVPTPFAVAKQMWHDRHSYSPNVRTTLREALIGYFWGNLIAIALGIVFELAPVIEGPLLRLAIASVNIPLVAIAPILVVVLHGDGPKAALAALSVFFTTLIATVLGLRSADRTSLDVIRAAGGGRLVSLRKVELWAALPSLLAGLRIAAPAALLGAVIGEYLGASQGLGVAMIQAQSSFEVARTWGIALVVSILAGVLYLLATLIARLVTPWAGKMEISHAGANLGRQSGGLAGRIARGGALAIFSVALMLAAWHLLIHGFKLNHFFAKDPEDVYRYLFTGSRAASHRTNLLDALSRTLKDALGGYLVGMALALIAAIVVVLSSPVERMLMPVAIIFRSIPLVALTPLIALLFGRGFFGVTAVVSIVTFFPTLVNVVVGLRSAPAIACDLVRASGGNQAMITWKVRLPYALPALFASARIAAPAAIGGATLAEWLATGKGLGSVLVISYSASNFNNLWSGAVLLIAVSIALYGAIGIFEGLALTKFGGRR
jgi:sulfonate transport system permease protein